MENPYRDNICNILNTHSQQNITADFLSDTGTEVPGLVYPSFMHNKGKEGKITNVL